MRIPIQYGLLTALGFIVWVVLAHTLVSNPQSAVHIPGTPIFANVLHFVMIFLGIKALERERGSKPDFKEALKTGVAIAFVYALTISLFVLCVVLFTGDKWLAVERGAATTPTRVLLLQAFAGLFFGTLIFGLIYSTVIAFFVAKRRSDQRGE
jgi:uncharacterized oligopeptide transporter (OPT) family protein